MPPFSVKKAYSLHIFSPKSFTGRGALFLVTLLFTPLTTTHKFTHPNHGKRGISACLALFSSSSVYAVFIINSWNMIQYTH